MKKLVIFPCLISFFLLFIACPMEDRDIITVYNHTEHNISFFLADFYYSDEWNPIYPDTAIIDIRWIGLELYRAVKDKPTWCEVAPLKDTYKEMKTDTLCFFIFDTDTINKYDWEMVQNEYKILQRYDLSLQDFKRLKYTLSYPPSEAMKNIKMYPPYGTK